MLPSSPVLPQAKTSSGFWLRPATLSLLAFFFLWLAFTRPVSIGGDTFWYVGDIRGSWGHGWTDSPGIWNFAHLLWRPLGRVLASLFLPFVLPRFGGDEQASITFLLTFVNVISSLVCCLTIYRVVWRITARPYAAAFIAGAFLFFNPILNYSRSGSPYVLGLTCSTAGLYFAAFALSSRRNAWLAGALSGLAAALWIPFILSIPAVALARLILGAGFNEPADKSSVPVGGKARIVFAVNVCIGAGVTLMFFYGLAMVCNHIGSVAALRAWIHGSSPESHDRTLMRMITGMVRSMYNLGKEGVWFKWYVLHDPYAHVGVMDLLGASLARMLLFYGTMVCLIACLCTSAGGRRLLLLLSVLTLPHIALALGYESSDPGRYVPPLGLLTIAFGYVIGSIQIRFPARVLTGALCSMPLVFNLAAARAGNIDRAIQQDAYRVDSLSALGQGSSLYVVNGYDSLFELRYAAPFHPINRRPMPAIQTILPYLNVPAWRAQLACAALRTWDHSGQMWITTRVLSVRPLRNWFWVEADQPVTWGAIHGFFQSFPHDQIQGGEDGFFLLSDTNSNRLLLGGCDRSLTRP